MTTQNAFHWKTGETSALTTEPKKMSSQLAYYYRKKAGQTGSRQNPDRQWRKRPAQEAKTMSDDERELHIKHCGELMEANYAQGNREAAMGWWQEQVKAINSRSPKQIERMERAMCFFDVRGQADQAMLEAQSNA